MPTTSTKYSVSNMRQLVDLNGDMTNFIVDFTAKSTNNEEFECLVVDQQTLDEGSDLQYKKVPGYINGNVSSDKNIYQNYFLILRSQNPCTVEVTLNSEQLSDELPIHKNNDTIPLVSPSKDDLIMLSDVDNSGIMSWLTNWKIIVAILVLVFVAYYVFYKNKNQSTSNNNDYTTTQHLEYNMNTVLPPPTPPSSRLKVEELKIPSARLDDIKLTKPVQLPLLSKNNPTSDVKHTSSLNPNFTEQLRGLRVD